MTGKARILITIGLIAAGVAAIVVGAIVAPSGSGYGSSVMVEIGAAILLVVPLFLLEQVFERRVEAAQEKTTAQVGRLEGDVLRLREETTAAVGELRGQLGARLQARREEDERAAGKATADASFENVLSLLDRASDLRALARRAVRVRLEGQWQRIRFKAATGREPEGSGARMIWISMEDASGAKLEPTVIWSVGESVVEVMARMVEEWQRAGTYPGQGALDADQVVRDLISAIQVAIRSRTGEHHGEPLSPLIELLNEDWVLTDLGLEHVGHPRYGIPAAEIANPDSRRQADMLEKTWVLEREEAFREAYEAAELFFRGSAARERRFVAE